MRRERKACLPLAFSDLTPKRFVADRLSDADIAELITAFTAGSPKQVLTERYGTGPGSVKTLLREHGVKKRSRYDVQASRTGSPLRQGMRTALCYSYERES